jgi:aryl-alcohol dehydrogenase-like predicted oxidoreductase
MRYRRLGRTGFHVSEIGYGAWGIGGTQWLGGDDRESLLALRHAIELGLNFIDTALAYGDGHSEELVGTVVREADHKIYVASKVAPKNQLWPARPGIPISEVFPYEHIMQSTERSLKNLKLDTIDLQQLHVWNPEWIARDEWKRAFEDIKRTGKAQAVGVSINDHQSDSALEIIKTGLIDSVQLIYNIFDQSPEKHLFPLAIERDIGVIARVPLDEGALTGKIDQFTQFEPTDFRARYFQGDRKKQVAERVAAIQRDLHLSNGALPELALRFCISHPAVSCVIPGMRTRANVNFNCSIPGKGPLPEKVIAILRNHAWERNFYGA